MMGGLVQALKLGYVGGKHDLADAVMVALSATCKRQKDAQERAASHHYVELSERRASGYDAPPAQVEDQPSEPGRTFYIDLAGVMADFDGAFPQVFGLDHHSLADEEMWGHINGHPSFFRDLPPMAGALALFRSAEHLKPVILTAYPKSNYPHVAGQKRACFNLFGAAGAGRTP